MNTRDAAYYPEPAQFDTLLWKVHQVFLYLTPHFHSPTVYLMQDRLEMNYI